MEKNIAIFASGSGTNAENIIRYFEGNDSVRVKLVLSNRKDAYVLERAHRLGVPCRAFPKSDWEIAESILDLLREHQIDLIVLAGFLLRIPDALLHAYPNKIINIHPALLPKFGGKGMYGDRVHEAVVMAGESESGITIQTSITMREVSFFKLNVQYFPEIPLRKWLKKFMRWNMNGFPGS